jgi:formamidopyrimidine-DNA glycosylase
VPELPEVETARRLIADRALHRRIVAVDDADTNASRPHSPGELRDALVGRTLTAAMRRGETMWVETSGVGGSAEPGPGDVIEARHPGGTCPRCGAEMVHGTVGGRSTWWCSREQAAWPDAA